MAPRRFRLSVVAGVLLAAVVAPAATASTWTLRSKSLLAEGCFERCACPIAANELSGSFEMVSTGIEDGFEVFAVSDIDWTTASAVAIHGSGTYRLDRDAGVQRLELALQIDGAGVELFDSGLVAAEAAFPAVEVVVAIEGPPACYDIRTSLVALPENIVALQKTTWSALKVLYTEP